MPTMKQTRLLLLCAGCFGLGIVLSPLRPQALRADPNPEVKAPPLPMDSRLASNVWLQNSGEYRACCLQVYQCAERRLEAILRCVPRPMSPAVVLDLDETVLDNSAFQNALYKQKMEYTQPRWDAYEEKYPQEVALVPGAQAFICKAIKAGVTVVYISNRSEAYRESTLKALRMHGLGTKEVLSLRAKGGSSDKSSRREEIAAKFNVVMYFGDNLRDFSEAFADKKLTPGDPLEKHREAVRRRRQQVDEANCHWGIDWFVLPNPVYGEWDRDALLGDDAKARLRPTQVELPR